MRWNRVPVALGALLVIGCAGDQPAKRDADGLVRIPVEKPGNLFVHESLSIDDYDDVWLAEIGIQYAPEQQHVAESDEREIRKMVYELVHERVPISQQLSVHQAGPCTVKLAAHLAGLSFPHPGFTGSRNRGAAVVIVEFRDSETNQPLVRYGQGRPLATASRRVEKSPDLDVLHDVLGAAFEGVGAAIDRGVPVKATGARADQGCRGAIGELRKNGS